MARTVPSDSESNTPPPYRPRVALVAASLEIVGGQSIEASLLADALRSDGYPVMLVAVNPRLPWAIRWVRKFRAARTLVNQMFYLPTLLRLVRADVVHVFSASYWSFLLASAPAVLTGRLFGKRVVLHYHSGEAADHLANWGWAVHPWLALAHKIVVPSAFLSTIFAAHGHETVVIANFIRPRTFVYRERTKMAPRLVSTRNLEPHYSVATVLDAYALIKKRYPKATLTLVGSGSEERRLRARAERLGADGIRFLGQVVPNDIPPVLGESDIFVNASTIDNQPLSVLEAFAAGLPVVSTAPGAIGELVRDHETGRLIPMNNPEAMAEAVMALVEEPEATRDLVRRARSEVDRYVWPVVQSAWAEVYGCVASVEASPSTGPAGASVGSIEG